MTGQIRLVTADDLCDAAAAVLEEHLGPLLEALQLDDPELTAPGIKPFKVPVTWTQLPVLEALQTAILPAGAITSTGIVPGTVRESSLGTDATFRLRLGVFDHGADYNDTANRARTWAALMRGVLLQHRTLGGVASTLRLVSESYRQFGQTSVARTLGGGVLEIDVDVKNIADLSALTDPGPNVASVESLVTARPY